MMQTNSSYNRIQVYKNIAMLMFMMILMKASDGAAFALFIPFVLFAAFTNKADKLLFWMLAAIAMLGTNGALAPKGSFFLIVHRVLMVGLGLFMTTKIFGGAHNKALTAYFGIMPYILFMAITAGSGWCPTISYLKLILFVLVYFAYVGMTKMVWQSRTHIETNIREVILAFAAYFLFGSVLLIFSGYGYMTEQELINSIGDGGLFKGMTLHSQCLGPMVAALNCFLLADMLFSVKKFDRLYCALLLACPLLIYKTGSRTGMGTYLLSAMSVLYMFVNSSNISRSWKRKAKSAMSLISVLVVAALFITPSGRDGLKRFVLKYNQEGKKVSVANVMETRQGKIDSTMDNFRKSPMIGNGFQVSESMIGFSGLSALTAPIEKGTWVTAILEEGGAIGFGLFIIFAMTIVLTEYKQKCYVALACTIALLLSNLGEFTMFSMTYMGGIMWMLVFSGLAFDLQRQKKIQAEQLGGMHYGSGPFYR